MEILRIILGIELVGLVVLSVMAAVFWNMIQNGQMRVVIRNKDVAFALYNIGLFVSIFLPTPLSRGICFAFTAAPLLFFMVKYVLYLFKTLRK